MAKFLRVAFPQKCTGCELCVFEVQRQLNKIGLDGALIRVFKSKNPESNFIKFSIDVDPRVNKLNVEKIKSICPTLVFDTIEEDTNGLVE